MSVRLVIRMQTGDWAIVAGVTAVCLYEKLVRNDSDLISNRVSAYRKHRAGRVVADAVILATAIHLMEAVPEDLDLFHHLMRLFRKPVDTPHETGVECLHGQLHRRGA